MSLRIDLGVAGLGAVRLTTDAVWETVASLHCLTFPRSHAVHARLRSLVPRSPGFDLPLLRALTSDPQWFPDLLAPRPLLDPPGPLGQIERLRGTPLEVVERDLAVLSERTVATGAGASEPSARRFLDRVCSALTGYFTEVLSPLWERVEAITDADVAHHSRRIARDGLAAGVAGIHDELEYCDGRLTVGFHRTDHTTSTGDAGLWLVPSVFRWPWVAAQEHDDWICLSYAARGAARVWEPGPREGADRPLAALLGRSRAALLDRLELPRTTTWLARELQLSPGTVSEHLSVMVGSGLLEARRDGRRVLYTRTLLGCELVEGGPRAWATSAPSRLPAQAVNPWLA